MEWFKKAEAMIGTPQENSEEQAELFRKAIQAKPDFLEAHYNLGLIYANQKKMKEAATEFEAVLKIEPEFDPNIYMLLAKQREAGNNRLALAALEGLRRKPKDPAFPKALAYLHFNSKMTLQPFKTCNCSLRRTPSPRRIWIWLFLYQRNGDLENAVHHYQAAFVWNREL